MGCLDLKAHRPFKRSLIANCPGLFPKTIVDFFRPRDLPAQYFHVYPNLFLAENRASLRVYQIDQIYSEFEISIFIVSCFNHILKGDVVKDFQILKVKYQNSFHFFSFSSFGERGRIAGICINFER